MNKAVIWLIVLVVVVGGVFLLARGKDDKGTEELTGAASETRPGFGETRYDILEKQFAQIDSDLGLREVSGQYYRYKVQGTGTLLAVQETEDGLAVDIDMNGDTEDGAEIFAEVPQAKLQIDSPSEGQKVVFNGEITNLEYTDGVLILDLFKTSLKAPPQ
jgi:hypothetical protein